MVVDIGFPWVVGGRYRQRQENSDNKTPLCFLIKHMKPPLSWYDTWIIMTSKIMGWVPRQESERSFITVLLLSSVSINPHGSSTSHGSSMSTSHGCPISTPKITDPKPSNTKWLPSWSPWWYWGWLLLAVVYSRRSSSVVFLHSNNVLEICFVGVCESSVSTPPSFWWHTTSWTICLKRFSKQLIGFIKFGML